MSSFNSYDSYKVGTTIIPILQRRNWDTEGLSNLHQITKWAKLSQLDTSQAVWLRITRKAEQGQEEQQLHAKWAFRWLLLWRRAEVLTVVTRPVSPALLSLSPTSGHIQPHFPPLPTPSLPPPKSYRTFVVPQACRTGTHLRASAPAFPLPRTPVPQDP